MLKHLTSRLVLRGEFVQLEPMQTGHASALAEAAALGELWNLEYTTVPTPQRMPAMIEEALQKRQQGEQFPFVVRLLKNDRIVGATRYYFIEPEHRNLSIGYTWYAEDVQRTAVNSECKLMLLEYAFETLNCISVQWHTDHRNKRSQAAIKRLGAKFEGVLRNHKIMPDGAVRHTHCFSMLDSEWPAAKEFLQQRISR